MDGHSAKSDGWVCPAICLGISGLGGLLLAALLLFFGEISITGAVFLGAVAAALGSWLLVKYMCGALEPLGTVTAPLVEQPAPTAAPREASKGVEETAHAAGVATGKAAVAVEEKAESAAEAVSDAADTVAETASDAADSVADTASDVADKAKETAEAAKAKAAETAAAAKKKAAEVKDFDGDGVEEGENEGSKPATLDGPREGGADNLKEIKGVGPKMEKMLNEMGFYHFDQIANWSADEVAWVNANLKGFKGRVTRDGWVDQAKTLASGGETEFSKRVDKGDVY